MYYDLNAPWLSNEHELKQRISFAAERYNVLVVSHLLPEKLTSDATSPITLPSLDQPALKRVKLLTRCTIPITSTANSPGPRIADLRKQYDIVAVRPVDEKTLLLAVTSLDSDIISLDLTQRYPFHFRPKTFAPALARGIKIELCYTANLSSNITGKGVMSGTLDAEQRRNALMNASEVVRSTRGRGIVISSEAVSVLGLRAPHDVINMAGMWGLSKELGAEAVGNGARAVVAAAQLRKRSFRGAVDVVEVVVGEQGKPVEEDPKETKVEDAGTTAAVDDRMQIDKDLVSTSQQQSRKKRQLRTSRGSVGNDATSSSKRSKK